MQSCVRSVKQMCRPRSGMTTREAEGATKNECDLIVQPSIVISQSEAIMRNLLIVLSCRKVERSWSSWKNRQEEGVMGSASIFGGAGIA